MPTLKKVAALMMVLAAPAHADQCFDYGEITIHGTLASERFPGPSNIESVTAGDRPESDFFIVPLTSTCVDEGGDPTSEPQASRVEGGQLIVADASSYNPLRPLLGQDVSCRGVLLGRRSGHHHSPVLLAEAECAAAQSMTSVPEPEGVGKGAARHGGTATQPASEDSCASALSQAALNRCAYAAADRADAELDRFIASYQEYLSLGQVRLLDAAQAAWQRFRRNACEFEASGVKGGSAHPMVLAHCLASKARDRLIELQNAAHCEEEDLGCPTHGRLRPGADVSATQNGNPNVGVVLGDSRDLHCGVRCRTAPLGSG